jgi:GNAT superfamily N-acetyltransferase
VARVIRELAENPNLHQAVGPGRRLHVDPGGRFAIYLGEGRSPHAATVQRVRVGADDVEGALAEIRALLAAEGREGAEWELGESSEPPDLVARLLALGLEPDDDAVAFGMVLRGPPPEPPAGVTARPVASLDELRNARLVQHAAFASASAVDEEQLRLDHEREGIDGTTFVALVDGEILAAAYAAYTPHGSILFGGATLPDARGRGAYRALVAARAAEAAARGAPAVVTHAGRMSRPILERLGFERVARIDRLLDVL